MPVATDNPGLIAPPPLVFAVFFGVAMLLQRFFPLAIPLYPPDMPSPGTVLIWLSGLIFLSSAIFMWRARTHMNPLLPTTALVTAGPYQFSRNPMSVALVVLYIGLALRLDTVWPLLLLPPLMIVFHYGVIQREERYLEGKFGDVYNAYRASVRRWI